MLSNRFSLPTTLARLRSLTSNVTRQDIAITISFSQMIERELNDLWNEPISAQHQRHFQNYFRSNLQTKIFTLDECFLLFQINSRSLGERLLSIFKLNESLRTKSISGVDVIRLARLLWISPMAVKALILFKLFDSNDQQKISMENIRQFYQEYLIEFQFFQDSNRRENVVETFLQGFFPIDRRNDENQLNFDEFYRILRENPSVFNSLYLISIPDVEHDENDHNGRWKRISLYVQSHRQRFVFLFLYLLILIGLIVQRIFVYKTQSIWRIIARIGGVSCHFHYILLVVLMLKQLMSFIRRISVLRSLIPVDDHIDAHRFVGMMFFISALIHSFGHILHFIVKSPDVFFESMFTTKAELGWFYSSATITGDLLLILLFIMIIGALQCVRQRSGFFPIFRYTHFLFWPIFILLILHARDFWKWALAPTFLYVLEKIFNFKRHFPSYGRTRLISVRIEDEHVFTLIIERPKNFHFRIGEYINICLPMISNEWHPFSISSGPERTDILRVNILKKKNWTRKVCEHFSSLNNQSFSKEDRNAVICIEGPFSTSTSSIIDCEHVVLIGAGIGITPYISALESLIIQLREQRCFCYQCGVTNYNQMMINRHKLKKIDFIWINRDVKHFAWFRPLLKEFENEQNDYLHATGQDERAKYLDIHLYCTSIRSNDQAMLGNMPYDLVANMYQVIQDEDMHTKLRTKTHYGRPPWKLIFAKFKAENLSSQIFFTGNRSMGNEIEKCCRQYEFRFQHEPYF